MSKKIISVGYEMPGYSELHSSYSSDRSLLDADIIVFASDFCSYTLDSFKSSHEGKPLFAEDDSFRLQEHTRHWRHELSIALEAGKTVFVFFVKYQEFFILTGQTEFAGSGKTARKTRIVTGYNNYKFLPVELGRILPKEGTEIIFSGNSTFSTFWKEFEDELTYESYIDGEPGDPLFFTKTGKKVVGTHFHVGRGNLVLLPVLKYDQDIFVKYNKKTETEHWTKVAIQFGNRLVQTLVDIDKALRAGGERTPAPTWVSEPGFDLAEEREIKRQIEKTSKKIDDLVTQKTLLIQRADQVAILNDLLFEKGKRLENAIGVALRILGYEAENYNDGELELDHVILPPEDDRFLGEAEGKDDSAVNIDKLRQLGMNIQEDLRRDDVEDPALGILFGNGHRLIRPSERREQFTEKCIRTAEKLNHILIRTSDLFRVVKYVKESGDQDFAKKCRDRIRGGVGKIVQFPDIPNSTSTPTPPTPR